MWPTVDSGTVTTDMGGQLMLVCGLVAVLLSPVILIDAGSPCGSINAVWPSERICGKHRPLKPKLTKRNARAGGLEVEAEHFPSFVHLEFSAEGHHWTCPGVLLSERYVLTHRSHWKRASEYRAPISEANLWVARAILGLGSESETEIEIESDCPHPAYAWWIRYDDDVVLFRLKQKADYDRNIQPACWHLDPGRRSKHSGLSAEMQAFLVVSSAMDRRPTEEVDHCNEGPNEEEDEPARRRRRPRGLRVLPVKETPCPGESGYVPQLCAKPNLSSYRGSPCEDDFGAPLLATIDGRQHVFGLLKWKHQENCRANISRVDAYLTVRQTNHEICEAAERCDYMFGR